MEYSLSKTFCTSGTLLPFLLPCFSASQSKEEEAGNQLEVDGPEVERRASTAVGSDQAAATLLAQGWGFSETSHHKALSRKSTENPSIEGQPSITSKCLELRMNSLKGTDWVRSVFHPCSTAVYCAHITAQHIHTHTYAT